MPLGEMVSVPVGVGEELVLDEVEDVVLEDEEVVLVVVELLVLLLLVVVLVVVVVVVFEPLPVQDPYED